MAFDLSTAKPESAGFDISTARPEQFNLESFQPTGDIGAAQPQPEKEQNVLSLAKEFAAGVNRPIFQLIDAFGTDTVNAALNLAGSQRQIPGALETFGAEKGKFAGPGLGTEIAAGTGELIPAATAIGGVLRAKSAALPTFQAGESTLTGITRQLGASTPAQDVAGATLAGIGQEIGEEVGGETGKLVGGVVAPVAVPLAASRSTANALLKKAAPSVDKLKETARGIYRSLDDSGISVPAQSFDDLADDIANTLAKEGADPDLTQKAIAVVNRFQRDKGTPKTLTELDTLRKVAKNAADSLDPSERRLGAIAIEKVDNFLDDVGGQVAGNKEAGQAFRSARDLWQRAKKSELLEQAVVDAQSQASGFENGLRTQFRQIAKKINRGKLKGFTAEEKSAIEKVNKGTNAGNIARFLGKFGVLDGVTSRSLTSLGGIAVAGGATGSPIAAGAVPLVGQLSGALAQRMTANNSRMASAIIRSGKNGNKITQAYIRNTPKAQQSASELAELFLKNEVPIQNIKLSTVRPLVADAAIIAAVARFNDEKEEL